MKYLILLLFITSVAGSTNYINYCKLKLNYNFDRDTGSDKYNCNGLSETSVVYETCCAGRDLDDGVYKIDTKSTAYGCGGDEDMCKKSTKFCEWKDGYCVDNPCGNADDGDKCLDAEFNGEQCKWVSHEKYSYCSSASSLTVGLSSLLVLYSTLF